MSVYCRLGSDCDVDWFRKVIQGKVLFRRCPDCIGRGYVWYDGYTGEVCGNQALEEEALKENCGDYPCTDMCDNCDGIGYVQTLEEE